MTQPPFAYYGGKTTIAPQIVELLPPHLHYVEPFAGSLAVLLAKSPSRYETVNDLNHDLMVFWRVLRDRPEDLIRACALTPHSRAELEESFKPSEDELEHARRVWVRLSQGRTGRLTSTGWRQVVKPAGLAAFPTFLKGYVKRMEAVAERLGLVSLECQPAAEVIARFGAHDGVLLYVDPPYLSTVRNGDNYQHEMGSEAAHEELARSLRACRATVLLSGYRSSLYDELYDGWHVTEIATRSAQGNNHEHRDGSRVEVLWSSVPLGEPDLFSG